MAEAIVRVNVGGSWREVSPVWSLGVESDEHGPTWASFVSRDAPPKYSDAEVVIGGLTVLDGWVESTDTQDGLVTVGIAGEQRHLDDDPLERVWFVSGFEGATDSRAGPAVNQAYWARSGLNLSEKSMVLGVQPNTIFYAQQAAGVTYDLGLSGAGPRKVWLYEQQRAMPGKAGYLYVYVYAHSTRSNHQPPTAGQFLSGGNYDAQGSGGNVWREFTFAANALRYVTVFLYSTVTWDIPKNEPEYFIRFTEARFSTMALPVSGSPYALNGSTFNPGQIVADIVGLLPRLSAGVITPSSVDLHAMATEGFQLPREVLERLNVEQWRYRVNPGRRLDFTPYPTLPIYTLTRDARANLKAPDTYSRVVVSYRDQSDEEGRVIRSSASPRQRTQPIELSSTATAAQATIVADAFMLDQAQRRVEGSVTVTPGTLLERPSGQRLHPSRLLLAGGERAHCDEAGDDARIANVSYTHDSETAEVSLSEPQDDVDREMALLEVAPDVQ